MADNDFRVKNGLVVNTNLLVANGGNVNALANLNITGAASVSGNTTLTGNVSVGARLTVTGNATLSANLTVAGSLSAGATTLGNTTTGKLVASGADGALTVTGTANSTTPLVFMARTDIAGAPGSYLQYGVAGDWYIRSANSTAGTVLLQDTGGPIILGATGNSMTVRSLTNFTSNTTVSANLAVTGSASVGVDVTASGNVTAGGRVTALNDIVYAANGLFVAAQGAATNGTIVFGSSGARSLSSNGSAYLLATSPLYIAGAVAITSSNENSGAQFVANSPGYVSPPAYWAAQAIVGSFSDNGTTLTPDFSLAINFSKVLTGSRTIANPSNATKVGQRGYFVFIQDGSGSRTVNWGSAFYHASADSLTLSTAPGTYDIIEYLIIAASSIIVLSMYAKGLIQAPQAPG